MYYSIYRVLFLNCYCICCVKYIFLFQYTVLLEPLWEVVDNKIKVVLPSKLIKENLANVMRHEMLNDHYQEYTKIYTDVSVDLEQSKSTAGYHTQMGERYFILVVPFQA